MVLSFWHQECSQPDSNTSHLTCKPKYTIRIFPDKSYKAIAIYSNNVYPKWHVALHQGSAQNKSRGVEILVPQSPQSTRLSHFLPSSPYLCMFSDCLATLFLTCHVTSLVSRPPGSASQRRNLKPGSQLEPKRDEVSQDIVVIPIILRRWRLQR